MVAVQQLGGSVLEPLTLGQVVKLHPLLVVPAVIADAGTFGVLGVFLAMPAPEGAGPF